MTLNNQKWPISADIVHNWINYKRQGFPQLQAFVKNVPDFVQSTIESCCKLHHKEGRSASDLAKEIANIHSGWLYLA